MKSKKLDKLILNFLKPVFEEHHDCQKLVFNIHSFDENDSFICEESISINNKTWDELPDDKLSKAQDYIHEAIGKLPDGIEGISEIKDKLKQIAEQTWEKACADPINKIWREFWKDKNLDVFNKLINKEYLKRFPSRYVDYTSVEVNRDGTIKYYPNGEDE